MPENPAACAFSVKQPNAAIIPAIAAIHTTAFFFRNIFFTCIFSFLLYMGWPSSALIAGTDTEDPESYAWVLTIPQTEFDGNPNMDPSKDQNPIGDHK